MATIEPRQEPCENMDNETTPSATINISNSENEQQKSPEKPSDENIDISAIDFEAPLPPALVEAGEAAMRELGLFDARTPSLSLAPWWAADSDVNRHVEFFTRERYAKQTYDCFHWAQRYNRKAERFRNQKMEMLQEMLFRRACLEKYESPAKENRSGSKPSITKPIPLPWGKGNVMKEWEGRDWLAIHGGEWPWENREEKRKYREGCKKMRRYREKALVCMTKTYVTAIRAVRAPSDPQVWGKQFG